MCIIGTLKTNDRSSTGPTSKYLAIEIRVLYTYGSYPENANYHAVWQAHSRPYLGLQALNQVLEAWPIGYPEQCHTNRLPRAVPHPIGCPEQCHTQVTQCSETPNRLPRAVLHPGYQEQCHTQKVTHSSATPNRLPRAVPHPGYPEQCNAQT
jgi:hypothetical protein